MLPPLGPLKAILVRREGVATKTFSCWISCQGCLGGRKCRGHANKEQLQAQLQAKILVLKGWDRGFAEGQVESAAKKVLVGFLFQKLAAMSSGG